MNILAIGAHPDDIEIGCAGSLLNYKNEGHDLYLMVMTQGEGGGRADTRRHEQNESAEILGCRDVIWGTYKDTELNNRMTSMIHDIEAVLKGISPDICFVNYYDDSHQDHRALNRAAVSASRYTKNVLFYEVPTTQNFSPSVFMNIKNTMSGKIEALLAHTSQAEKTNIEGLSIVDIAKAAAVFRGIQGRVELAEGFVPLRLFLKA